MLIANPRDIKGFVTTLRKTRFTAMSGVNTLYNALASAPDITTVDFSHLRMSNAGGMAVQEGHRGSAGGRSPATSFPRAMGCPRPPRWSPPTAPSRQVFTGTIGVPMPSTEVSLRAPEDGAEVPVGAPGELCVRGPQVMRGYWQAPDATAAAFDPDGFFPRDVWHAARRQLQDRRPHQGHDLRSPASRSTPNEVEGVIAGHPEASEVGRRSVLPDNIFLGQAVNGRRGQPSLNLTEDVVRAFCREKLAAYRCPKHVVFRDSLPKTNVGKVLRRALRDEAMNAGKTNAAKTNAAKTQRPRRGASP